MNATASAGVVENGMSGGSPTGLGPGGWSGAEAFGEQLAGVPARGSDAETGGAYVGDCVVVADVCAVMTSIGALHLQFCGHPEPQC